MVSGPQKFNIEPQKASRHALGKRSGVRPASGFTCAACRGSVATSARVAGVLNRNHCPYCLWSKHLDLHTAGDRLAACKERMRPIGVGLKQQRKKYLSGSGSSGGELMLVHQCLGCGKISMNRIAADDDGETVIKVFQESLTLPSEFAESLREKNVHLLGSMGLAAVRQRLFGKE